MMTWLLFLIVFILGALSVILFYHVLFYLSPPKPGIPEWAVPLFEDRSPQ